MMCHGHSELTNDIWTVMVWTVKKVWMDFYIELVAQNSSYLSSSIELEMNSSSTELDI